jgi:hypothetical protein
MRVLYDTTTVHPLDRYDYYRAGATTERAPVTVRGREPGHLLARMEDVSRPDRRLRQRGHLPQCRACSRCP